MGQTRIAAIKWFGDMERSAKYQAVTLAAAEGVCRLCLKRPTLPLVLDFGNEYACEECLRATLPRSMLTRIERKAAEAAGGK